MGRDLAISLFRDVVRLTCAQQCLIIVSRGVSNDLTSCRASASSRSRALSVFETEKLFPSVCMEETIEGTLSTSFGDTATSVGGGTKDL